jgi:hypothetical protein
LRKASLIPKVKTSFSIVASSAGELSGCDSSAEVETRAEGEEVKTVTVERDYRSDFLLARAPEVADMGPDDHHWSARRAVFQLFYDA